MKLLVCVDGEWTVRSQSLAKERHSCSGTTETVDYSQIQASASQPKPFEIADIDPVQMSEMFAFGFFLLLFAWASIMPIVSAIKSMIHIFKG